MPTAINLSPFLLTLISASPAFPSTATSSPVVQLPLSAEVILSQWSPDSILEADSTLILQCFTASLIPDSIFSRMQGKSYKSNCTIPRSDLRYLTIPHHDGHGNIRMGEIVCNQLIADDLIDIFRKAFIVGYPIERMMLIDNYDADDRKSMTANNTSCFNFRVVAGSKKLSNHAKGLAIDINPLYNPYVKRRTGKPLYVSPPNGKAYADRNADYPYKIDPATDTIYRLFIEHGFRWGGVWRSAQDYQHFEKP